MRRFAFVLLSVAVLLGGYLRFSDLGRLEMSDDEGASWAAAAAPSISEVIALQTRLNPGKLAVHEVLLHGWMRLFGDGIAAQRALSATLGTFSIVIVFWIGWELFVPLSDPDDGRAAMVAALGALIYAVNLVTIKYAREARMYPVMLTAALLQVGFFVRGSKRGGFVNYAGAGLFAIIAISAHFAAALVPATEGLWLLYLLGRSGIRLKTAESRRAWSLIAALAIAAAAFFAFALSALHGATSAVEGGAIEFIKRPPLWAPIALYNKATGTFGFPVLALAAAYGVIRGWGRERDAIAFSLLWMWGPPVLMMLASFVVTPLFVERYALSSFAPFFILAAIGMRELGGIRSSAAALVLVVAVSIGHIVVFNRKPHDAQWKEAAQVTVANLNDDETLTTVPPYSVSVVRYYLPLEKRDRAILRSHGQPLGSASIVMLRDHGVSATAQAEVRKAYPVELAHLRGVEVLKK